MTLENSPSLIEHKNTGKFWCAKVFSSPMSWKDSLLGRAKLRLAFYFPSLLAEEVATEAPLSLSKSDVQSKIPRIVAARRFDGERIYFAKVVPDRI